MANTENNSLIDAFKSMYWELRDKFGRFEYIHYLLRETPGNFGMVLRRRFLAPYFESCGRNLRIHPGTRFRNVHQISVGDNVELGVDNFFQAGGGLTIHNGTILGPGVKIWTVNHRFDDLDVPIIDQGYDEAGVVLGPNVWLGANVFIMPGVELAEGCVVSAGAVVGAKKYPPYSILSGNPARVIGNRKKEPKASSAGE